MNLRRMSMLALVAAAAVLAVGCRDEPEPVPTPDPAGNPPAPDGTEISINGTVQFFDGGVAIGAEADPTGYILANQLRYDRLYLRADGSLQSPKVEEYLNQAVAVTGKLDTITVGGVETDQRSFRVLDVTLLRPQAPRP